MLLKLQHSDHNQKDASTSEKKKKKAHLAYRPKLYKLWQSKRGISKHAQPTYDKDLNTSHNDVALLC